MLPGMNAYQGKIIINAVSGQFCRAQLFNPATSGKTVLVDSILSIMGPTPADVIFYFTQLAHATDGGAWRNVLASGAAGVAHVRSETGSGCVVNPFGDIYLLASAMLNKAFANPLVLPAGWGVTGETNVANNAIGLWFEGREY